MGRAGSLEGVRGGSGALGQGRVIGRRHSGDGLLLKIRSRDVAFRIHKHVDAHNFRGRWGFHLREKNPDYRTRRAAVSSRPTSSKPEMFLGLGASKALARGPKHAPGGRGLALVCCEAVESSQPRTHLAGKWRWVVTRTATVDEAETIAASLV